MNHFLRRLFWAVLTIAIVVSLDLIIARFLWDSFPVLAMVLMVATLIVSFVVMPSPETRRTYKTIFLSALVVSTGFATVLHAGFFDSMMLLDDSWIDLSHSAVIFHLRNNGFIDWRVKEVKLGNITLTLKYPHGRGNLQAGGTAHLIIYFNENSFQWIPPTEENWTPKLVMDYPFEPEFPMDWPCSTDEEISPWTFQNGSSYPVVFDTNSILKHAFNLEAKFTTEEQLNVTARKGFSKYRQVWVYFNNTGRYYSYVYTIQIVNVTFRFNPPMRIHSSTWEEIRLYFPKEEIERARYAWSVFYNGEVYATPTHDFPCWRQGKIIM